MKRMAVSGTRRNFRTRARSICCWSAINRRANARVAACGRAHAQRDGSGRYLRPDRRRVPSLFGGRALVRAALRENDVRQFRAAEEFSARLSGDGQAAVPRNRRRNYRVGRRSSCPISERGGFYGSQDADQTLDDDGDYFTWTLAEVRAVLSPEESRVIEIYYDVGAARRNAPQSRKRMFCGLRRTSGRSRKQLKLDDGRCLVVARAREGKIARPRGASGVPRRRSTRRSMSAGTRCSFPPISKRRAFWAAMIAARLR